MNALQKAQLALEEKRAVLGKLLDVETRGEDFDDKLKAAKDAVTSAQTIVLAAGLAEPEVEEHREDTKAGAELRGLLDGANVGAMFDSVLGGSRPSGEIAELHSTTGSNRTKSPSSSLPANTTARSRRGPSRLPLATSDRTRKESSDTCFRSRRRHSWESSSLQCQSVRPCFRF